MDNFSVIFDELGAIILDCIKRKDTKHEIFHGCYDWHSSVHGFWALFRISRVNKQNEEWKKRAEYAYSRITSTTPDSSSKSIDVEAAHLLSQPSFEMPYGRAWFLRLVKDFELWCQQQNDPNFDTKALRGVGCDVASSMLEYFKTDATMNPELPEYKNPSWALIQLHDFYSHIEDEEGIKNVSSLVQKHFIKHLAQPSLSFDADYTRNEFFSIYGNLLYCIALASPDQNHTLSGLLDNLSQNEILPVQTLGGSAHQYGMNWSRGWSFAFLGKVLSKDRLLDAAKSHIEAGIAHHNELQSNSSVTEQKKYYLYNHWVPQFMVYCITLLSNEAF